MKKIIFYLMALVVVFAISCDEDSSEGTTNETTETTDASDASDASDSSDTSDTTDTSDTSETTEVSSGSEIEIDFGTSINASTLDVDNLSVLSGGVTLTGASASGSVITIEFEGDVSDDEALTITGFDTVEDTNTNALYATHTWAPEGAINSLGTVEGTFEADAFNSLPFYNPLYATDNELNISSMILDGTEHNIKRVGGDDWGLRQDVIGSNDFEPFSGTAAIRLKVDGQTDLPAVDAGLTYGDAVNKLAIVAGTTYILKCKINVVSLGAGTNVLVYGEGFAQFEWGAAAVADVSSLVGNGWSDVEMSFTPNAAGDFNLIFRLNGEGEVYIDDIFVVAQ